MFPEFKRQKISKCQTWRQATQVLASKYNSIIRFSITLNICILCEFTKINKK